MRLSDENLALTPENTIHPVKQPHRHKTSARDVGQRKNMHYNTRGYPLKLAEYVANGELLSLSPSDKKDLSAWFMVGTWPGPEGDKDNLKVFTP